MIPARINLITLLCRDMPRMTSFYRQFAWPEAPASEEPYVVFQCTNGVVLSLWAASNYEAELGPVAEGFHGFTLGINCRDFEEVNSIYETVKDLADVRDLEAPRRTSWGGGFTFRDPEGNVWDVAWAEGSRFDEQGGLTFP